MGSPSIRISPAVVRVGDKEVVLKIIEEYPADCGAPTEVRIAGPNGLATKGKPAEAWQEMLELLGVRKPAVSDQQSGLSESEQPGTPSETQGPSAAPGRVSAGIGQRSRINPEIEGQDPGKKTVNDSLSFVGSNSKSLQTNQSETLSLGSVESVAKSFSPSHNGSSQILENKQNQRQNQNPAGAAAGPDEFEDDMKLHVEEEREEVEAEETPELNQNVMRDSLLRLLNRRIYSDDPPLKIDEKMVAFIPYLESTQEAANLIRHIDENIQLTEMQADASRRASNLNYLKKANRAKRCGHVKLNGQTCGSPALRGQQYCHFHAQAHGASLDLPLIEDESSLQLAYLKLAQQIAANKIDPAQARILLQVLDKAGRGIPKSASMVERRFPGI